MLELLGDSIWAHETQIRFGGLPLSHRMTVIRLAGGGVVLHSPTRIDPCLADEIRRLGSVVAIVAPSWWHDLYLRETVRTFPEALLFGAQTLVRWRRAPTFADTLTDVPPALWQGEIDQQTIAGIGLFLDEVALYHRASKSLIVADLLFNLGESDARLTRALAPIVIGPYPGCRFARLYRPFVLDRRRFRNAIERIADWDFDRIIVGHGRVVEFDAKSAFCSAFHWLLEAPRSAG
jgi:Domain of unknown function (DUF4336)